MGFLKNLFGGGKSAARDEHAMFYYVQCKKCGEKVRVRVDARWDLDQEYEGQGDLVSGYVARKEVQQVLPNDQDDHPLQQQPYRGRAGG